MAVGAPLGIFVESAGVNRCQSPRSLSERLRLNWLSIGLSFLLGIGMTSFALGLNLGLDLFNFFTSGNVLALSSIALLVATIALAISGAQQVAIAKKNIEVTKEQVQILLLDQVIRQIEDQRPNWAFLYTQQEKLKTTQGKDAPGYLGANLEKAEAVAVSFDRIALFIEEQDYVTEKVLSLFGPTILGMWEILRPYIEFERTKTPRRSNWVYHFEELSNKQVDRSKDQHIHS